MLHNSETKTCDATQAGIMALLDNELSPDEAAALRSHIEGCVLCTPIFAQIEKTVQLAHAWKSEGADIWDAVEQRLACEPVNPHPESEVTLPRHHRLHEILKTAYVLSAEQLAEALYVQKVKGGNLDKIILDLGYAQERDLLEAKAHAEGLSFIDLTKHTPEASALRLLPRSFALKRNALPVKKDGNKLWVAMLDPQDVDALDEIRLLTRCQVAPLLAVPSDFEQAIAEAYSPTAAAPNKSATHKEPAPGEDQEDLRAVLNEMRALRTEIQELRGEVGTLRRLLSATQMATASKVKRPLPPQWIPDALPENGIIGLL